MAENTDSGRIKRIHEKVKQVRKSEKAGLRIMQMWEELYYERKEGRAEGKATSILELLEDIEPVPLELREEIMSETNEEILKKWLLLAARVKSIGEFIEKCHMESGEAI